MLAPLVVRQHVRIKSQQALIDSQADLIGDLLVHLEAANNEVKALRQRVSALMESTPSDIGGLA